MKMCNWTRVFNCVSPAMMLKSNKILNERLIEQVSSTKHLGVQIDNHLFCDLCNIPCNISMAPVSTTQSIRDWLVACFCLQRKRLSV